MPVIQLVTLINAPIQRVFDLSRNVDAHVHSTRDTSEVAISGVTSGFINLGDEIEWEAHHFGVRLRLLVKITKFERPYHFQDTMVRGAFSMMCHDHFFKEIGNVTEIEDVFEFKAPLGLIGKVAEKLFLTHYMALFLKERNRILKHLAETDEWREFLDDGAV